LNQFKEQLNFVASLADRQNHISVSLSKVLSFVSEPHQRGRTLRSPVSFLARKLEALLVNR
jgi:hypothetical protein